MKDIELRFVTRPERTNLDTYTAIVRQINVLQYRKLVPQSAWDADYNKWTEWQDVPLEIEEGAEQ
jgi:hypothetical protein